MATESPLNSLHQQAEASFLWYGGLPAGAVGDEASPASLAGVSGAAVVETFGEIEAEYAAIRKGCVVIDTPQRGTVRVSGQERATFLNRMVTQELKGLEPFGVRDAFWLNRRGRIDAQLRMIQLHEEMFIDVDALVAASTASSLGAFVFAEDVEFQDLTQSMHRLALHGPTAAALLAEISEQVEGPSIPDLADAPAEAPSGASVVRIAGKRVILDRRSDAGEIGFGLLMETNAVIDVYEQILERGIGAAKTGLRSAGWAAYNVARIEAGTPLFNVDYGPKSLPAESGVLDRLVSFTKGCYLGQEVVARMKSLGHPKQTLVGLRISPPPGAPEGAQPVTGAALTAASGPADKPVGAVTSSARSPMLGDAMVCFAQVKWDHAKEGAALLVETDAGPMPATVKESLVFWSRASARS